MTDQKPKILCVDDEHSVSDALVRLLRKDFDIVTAESGEKGLEILRNNNDFSIVLSDFRMPGINGIEFLQQVKRLAPNAVRAILSGQMDSKQIVNAINNAEIHRFILKPWDNEYLRIQMLEAVQSHQKIEKIEHFKKLSITDPVTGLTNHRYFHDRLSQEIELAQKTNEPLSLLIIDVDHFKSFNDRYGHPEGDRLLASVADRIKTISQDIGLASRYGGEEFTVILPKISLDQAYNLAEEIRSSLEQKAFIGPQGRSAYVTISLGLASFPEQAKTTKSLIDIADKALYQAKKQGRNQTVKANKHSQ